MTENRPHERRIQKRVPFIKEIEIVGFGKRRCTDISIGGLYLETLAAFPEGTLLDLRFKLQDYDPEPILVQCRVTYVHPGLGVGLLFANLSAENREKIDKWMSQR